MTKLHFPSRHEDGHKGTFGTVCVIGGQRSEDGVLMVGAPTLTANAAMRSGCGKTILAMPQPVLQTGLQLAPSATGIALPVDDVGRIMPSAAVELLDAHACGSRCLAIGPGFGSEWAQQQLIATLLARDDRPVVLDADGLNALAQLEHAQLDLKAPIIMTPHIGEYRHLADAQGIQVDPKNVEEAAKALAQSYGCVVVLKSHMTVVTDGVQSHVNDDGSVVLATGGSGDVLAGIIAGLLVQFGVNCIDHLMDAAITGVAIHADVGNQFVKEHGSTGMIAPDMLLQIPDAISRLKGN